MDKKRRKGADLRLSARDERALDRAWDKVDAQRKALAKAKKRKT